MTKTPRKPVTHSRTHRQRVVDEPSQSSSRIHPPSSSFRGAILGRHTVYLEGKGHSQLWGFKQYPRVKKSQNQVVKSQDTNGSAENLSVDSGDSRLVWSSASCHGAINHSHRVSVKTWLGKVPEGPGPRSVSLNFRQVCACCSRREQGLVPSTHVS